MCDSEQQLFLIEFFVDHVNIPTVQAMHAQMLPMTTCVSFQILSLPPVNIEQATESKECMLENTYSQVFNKGKSCLFALPTVVLKKLPQSFPIIMSVYKKLPPEVLPDVMLIGSHQIQAKDLINTALKCQVFKSTPSSKTCREIYKITTATGQAVGEIKVSMRVSCFGRKIVTQFQIPHNKKPFLFKGNLDSPVIQCQKISSEIEFQEAKFQKCISKAVETQGNFSVGKTSKNCCSVPSSSPVLLKSVIKQKPEILITQKHCYPFSKNQSNPGAERISQASSYPTGKSSYGVSFGDTEFVRKCGCAVKMQKSYGCNWKS